MHSTRPEQAASGVWLDGDILHCSEAVKVVLQAYELPITAIAGSSELIATLPCAPKPAKTRPCSGAKQQPSVKTALNTEDDPTLGHEFRGLSAQYLNTTWLDEVRQLGLLPSEAK
eukprot:6484636-Amphidinium_carterae.1